jgi:lysine-specific demethylase 8
MAKKETRVHEKKSMQVKDFIKFYEDPSVDAYAVTNMPMEMLWDIHLPPFIRCGGGTKTLNVANLWWSSGGTKSVLHKDGADNMLCVLAGTKRVLLINGTHQSIIEHPKCGWVNARKDGLKGYGEWAQKVDVEKVDYLNLPCYHHLPWYEANVEAGNCLFIPAGWYHHVSSEADAANRSLSVTQWWHRQQFWDQGHGSCDDDAPIPAGNCRWLQFSPALQQHQHPEYRPMPDAGACSATLVCCCPPCSAAPFSRFSPGPPGRPLFGGFARVARPSVARGFRQGRPVVHANDRP